MGDADTLDQLVQAAIAAGIPAVHLVQDGERVRILVRAVSGLAPVHSVVATPEWLEAAQALPNATRRGARVVIDLSNRDSGAGGFAELGMPGSMRTAIERELLAPGGVIVIASEDPAAMARAMAAAASAPGERHILDIAADRADRADLDAAARMDCDAILLRPSDDRGLLAAAFDHAQRGMRIVLGIEAPDAMAAIARLRAARVERHLLAFVLRVAIAARTEMRLCPACRRPAQAEGSESALLGVDPGTVIYRAMGCAACDHDGFSGTVMLFESVVIDPGLRRLLAEGGDVAILARHAFVRAPTLAASARALAREGRITVDAAIRIARAAAAGSVTATPHPHLLMA
ncbi:ATPase, T2SS/T4P/T4SS family [Sphingomonas sp.]|uniref:ATPase, T2SS/T4P/T4SS family n=1 Tax=Sphingomonas sp. TaxID=28214 RepID=UPI003F703F19